MNEAARWLRLKIKRIEQGQLSNATGIVEFVVRYKSLSGKAVRIHKIGEFLFEGNQWFYTKVQD